MTVGFVCKFVWGLSPSSIYQKFTIKNILLVTFIVSPIAKFSGGPFGGCGNSNLKSGGLVLQQLEMSP